MADFSRWNQHAAIGNGVVDHDRRATLPSGWTAAPLPGEPPDAVLRTCLVLAPGDGAGPVLLDGDMASTGWLGALVDRSGAVRQWLEVRVQGVGEAGPAGAPWCSTGNARRDASWRENVAALHALDPDGALSIGWEERHPPPMWIDSARRAIETPVDGQSGEPLTLCTDEALLAARGLPSYASSDARFLHVPALAERSPAVAVAAGSEPTAGVVPIEEIVPKGGPRRPFNLGAGFVAARRLDPFGLDVFTEMLGEAGWSGLHPRLAELPVDAGLRRLADRLSLKDPSPLFLSREGAIARLAEVIHLKLCLLHDAWSLVRRCTERLGLPLLNVEAASFRVQVAGTGGRLPLLWTSRLVLARPGAAVRLRVPGIEDDLCVPVEPSAASIYWPAPGPAPVERPCVFRMTDAPIDSSGRTTVRGRVQSNEGPMGIERTDLLFVRIAGVGRMVEIVGHLAGDWHSAGGDFVSLAQTLEPSARDELQRMKGVAQPRTRVQRLPIGSSARDVHALGVLAIRLLLCGGTTLPEACRSVDELRGALLEDRAEHATDDASARVGRVLAKHRSLADALAPRRASATAAAPLDAAIPARLWHEILAFVAGAGGDPDQPGLPGADISRFDPGIAALDRLVARSRSLVFSDWSRNHEVRDVLRQVRAKLGM